MLQQSAPFAVSCESFTEKLNIHFNKQLAIALFYVSKDMQANFDALLGRTFF